MASVSKRTWIHKGTAREAWVVRYKDEGGTHRSRQFERKKDADAYRRTVETEIDAGVHTARGASKTLGATMDEFLADIERRVREGQVGQGYLEQSRMMLAYPRETLGNVLLTELKWQQVEKFGRDLRQRRTRQTDRILSNSTIRTALNALRMAVSFGVRRGYASRNVVSDALKELGSLPVPKIETFKLDEMRRLLAAAEDRPKKTTFRMQAFQRLLVLLGGTCGLRRGEMFGLRWQDIDFDARMIHVRKSLTKRDELKGPKTTAGVRDVPAPSMLIAALEAWRPYSTPNERDLVFRAKHGGAYRDSDFYRIYWHPLLIRAGLGRVGNGSWRHFHALRHFAGSAWLDAGVPLPEVSRLMGHANMAVTARIYSHAILDVAHRAPAIERCAANLSCAPALPAPAQELRKAA